VSEDDLAAANRTLAYVEAKQDVPATVVPLPTRRALRERRQNTDNRMAEGRLMRRIPDKVLSVTFPEKGVHGAFCPSPIG
jgi:hypothetical protein